MISESTTTALIVGGFGFLASILASVTSVLISRRGSERIIERVIELKKNTDGMHSELMTLKGRAYHAEGHIQGAAEERARDENTALVTEPRRVAEAMNGKVVREQIDLIEAAVVETNNALAEQPKVRTAVRRQIDTIEEAVNELADGSAKSESTSKAPQS